MLSSAHIKGVAIPAAQKRATPTIGPATSLNISDADAARHRSAIEIFTPATNSRHSFCQVVEQVIPALRGHIGSFAPAPPDDAR